MRIQHNIMAMNAYRNYTNNVSAMKANLEKLSSGYKINRAGDDAAGLAISEKMRAQITGLQTAQKNAKDGISLVQTAEGALTEVHDMLNRMVELATQSANGTYDNTTDRDQLQKEVDQLRSEINRIADSANFNGIKLLDGSMAAVEGVEGSTTTEAVVGNYSGMDRIITSVIGQGEKAHEVVGEKTILDGNSDEPTKAVFSVDLNTMDFEMGTYYEVSAGTINVNFGGTKIVNGNQTAAALTGTITIGTAAGANDVAGNYKVGDEFEALASVADPNGGASVKVKVTVTIGSGGTYQVSGFGEAGQKVTLGSTAYTLYTSKGSGQATEAQTVDIKNTFSVTVNGTKLTSNVLGLGSVTNKSSSAAIAKLVASSIASQNGVVEVNGMKWTVAASNGKLTFSQIKTPETADEARANFDVKFGIADVKAGEEDFKITLGGSNKTTGGDGKVELTYSIKGGTVVETPGIGKGNSNKANTIFNIREEDIVDGTKIAIGTRTLTLAVGLNSTVKEGMAKASAGKNGYVEINETDDLNTALDKISQALGSTVNFLILDKNGQEQKISFQIGVSDSSMGYPTGLAVQRVNSVASDGKTNSALKDLAFDSVEKLAANFKMKVDGFKTTTVDAVEAKDGLKLQIGDTADDFNQLKVSIKDMHTDAMGIGDISIADQDSAAAAVDKIKAAINYVSDVRGTLGATQNRLDHTINNLSVMTENIQDAESTIRDTDVAEEMMAYTKNNILIQSAQAMLAQANQVPQGVLQLLQ